MTSIITNVQYYETSYIYIYIYIYIYNKRFEERKKEIKK